MKVGPAANTIATVAMYPMSPPRGGWPSIGGSTAMVHVNVVGGRSTSLPTLRRAGTDHYLVHDPAVLADGEHVIAADGSVRHRRPVRRAVLAIAAIGAGAAAGGVLPGQVWVHAAGAVGGALVAAVAAGRLLARSDATVGYTRRTGRAPSIEVAAPRGLRLCRIAEEISATRAWRSGEIDVSRELGALLWSGLVEPSRHAAVEGRLGTMHRAAQDADRRAWHRELAGVVPEPAERSLRDA